MGFFLSDRIWRAVRNVIQKIEMYHLGLRLKFFMLASAVREQCPSHQRYDRKIPIPAVYNLYHLCLKKVKSGFIAPITLPKPE